MIAAKKCSGAGFFEKYNEKMPISSKNTNNFLNRILHLIYTKKMSKLQKIEILERCTICYRKNFSPILLRVLVYSHFAGKEGVRNTILLLP